MLFVFFTSSCFKPFMSPSAQLQEPLEYCNLLHVPADQISYKPTTYLGITFSPIDLDRPPSPYKCNTFVQVESVINETPAMKAALKEKDIILSINGNPVCGSHEDILMSFKMMIEGQKAGSIINIGILRNGERFSGYAELEEMPYHRQPEADHSFSRECNAQPSKLETALNNQNARAIFQNIITGLSQQSDVIHNPDWHNKKLFNPFQLKEMTYMLRHPLRSGEVGRELSHKLLRLTDKDNWAMAEIVKSLAYLLDIDITPSYGRVEITFPNLVKAMMETNSRVEHALRNLSQEERTLFIENALKPLDNEHWNKLIEISLKIDLKGLLEALNPLLYFLTNDNISLLRKDLIRRFGDQQKPILYEESTPFGKVIVGGTGPNVYTEDAAMILDLGGDDIYLNNAGGTRPGMNVALVIDWEGNDMYLSRDNFSQGAGLLGGGFLIDLSGNDTFSSLDGSQGAGFFGIGILYRNGGNSFFDSRSFSQGVGQMGIGYLWNGSGDDVYICSEYGQALGLFRGAGILIDRAGNDYYRLGGLEPDFRDPSKSTVSMGQGFGRGIRPEKGRNGVSGGIGILIDQEGNDTYIADYFAQGASYYYGVGILNDMKGNDHYISGRYSQGAGIHSSVGVLIDQEGNDFYYASYGVAQGIGHDYGVGYLEDSRGNDRYIGGTLVQGAATHGGIGILIDLEGKDSYTCNNNGQAFVQGEECIGIMIDAEPDNDFITQHKVPESVRLGIKKSSN